MLELRLTATLLFSSITRAGPAFPRTKRTLYIFSLLSRIPDPNLARLAPNSRPFQVRFCSAEVRQTMAPPGDRDILPDIIKPVNYELSLFNLEFGGKWSYDGLVKIASKVKQATNELVINTNELDIKGAEVLGQDGGGMWH